VTNIILPGGEKRSRRKKSFVGGKQQREAVGKLIGEARGVHFELPPEEGWTRR